VAEQVLGQHGGKRPGAGRPKGSQSGSMTPYEALARARAKREIYKAHMAEMEFQIARKDLYRRDDILRVITTTIAIFAEQIRSLPDKLEREGGLTPKQAEIAEREVDNQLEEIRSKLIRWAEENEDVESGQPDL